MYSVARTNLNARFGLCSAIIFHQNNDCDVEAAEGIGASDCYHFCLSICIAGTYYLLFVIYIALADRVTSLYLRLIFHLSLMGHTSQP